jgi:UDP-glucose 4-epimerase
LAGSRNKAEAGRVVAVTGGSNFLGSQLAARIDADPAFARVVVLDASSSIAESPRARHYDIDLARPGADARIGEALAAEGVDTVVHAALAQAPTLQVESAHELESIGTMNVLSACESSPVANLIVWSHTLLYGARPDNPALLPETWPLRADASSSFVKNKLEVEEQVAAFAARNTRAAVAVVRTAPVVGPNSRGIVTAMMRRRLVPVVAGFDPLSQVIHEYDVVEAFKRAVDLRAAGVFNVTAEGVLPLSTAILLAGRLPVPIVRPMYRGILDMLRSLRISEASMTFAEYLTWPCVADGSKAARELGFHATYTTQEAICDVVARPRRRKTDHAPPPGGTP